MSRPLVRVPLAGVVAGEVGLPPRASHYLAHVHRLGPGDRFVAFDPQAETEAEAEIIAVTRRGGSAHVRLGPPRPASLRPARRVTLIQALGRGSKVDAVVRDATELGATCIAPVLSARSVGGTRADRSGRLRRIAVEAARQCGRGDAPLIEPTAPLPEALRRHAPSAGSGLGLCLHPRAATPLGAALRELRSEGEVVLVVGPEGGLTDEELGLGASLRYRAVSLGPLVLRSETVCAAALGALLAWGAAR
ncbi:MAG: RsmE family RNA methyltransferase [Deltaproteobacteria bacterium]|nr:RsmE family RNA methyltransferase [Deltaproteobacteria bacterium]